MIRAINGIEGETFPRAPELWGRVDWISLDDPRIVRLTLSSSWGIEIGTFLHMLPHGRTIVVEGLLDGQVLCRRTL